MGIQFLTAMACLAMATSVSAGSAPTTTASWYDGLSTIADTAFYAYRDVSTRLKTPCACPPKDVAASDCNTTLAEVSSRLRSVDERSAEILEILKNQTQAFHQLFREYMLLVNNATNQEDILDGITSLNDSVLALSQAQNKTTETCQVNLESVRAEYEAYKSKDRSIVVQFVTAVMLPFIFYSIEAQVRKWCGTSDKTREANGHFRLCGCVMLLGAYVSYWSESDAVMTLCHWVFQIVALKFTISLGNLILKDAMCVTLPDLMLTGMWSMTGSFFGWIISSSPKNTDVVIDTSVPSPMSATASKQTYQSSGPGAMADATVTRETANAALSSRSPSPAVLVGQELDDEFEDLYEPLPTDASEALKTQRQARWALYNHTRATATH